MRNYKEQAKFNVLQSVKDINDSMLLDSGTVICTFEFEGINISIEVRGEVRVVYNNEVYKNPSEFPEELKALIRNSTEENPWDCDMRVFVDNNNWFELSINNDEFSDLVDIENFSDLQLLSTCTNFLDYYKASKEA